MYRKSQLFLAWFLIFLSVFGCGAVKTQAMPEVKVVNEYHKPVESDYCSQCHIQQGSRYKLKAFDPVKACMDCHASMGHSHPLSPLSPEIKTELPLYNQKITCLTCHDPHNRRGYPALLRKEAKILCLDCHQK